MKPFGGEHTRDTRGSKTRNTTKTKSMWKATNTRTNHPPTHVKNPEPSLADLVNPHTEQVEHLNIREIYLQVFDIEAWAFDCEKRLGHVTLIRSHFVEYRSQGPRLIESEQRALSWQVKLLQIMFKLERLWMHSHLVSSCLLIVSEARLT